MKRPTERQRQWADSRVGTRMVSDHHRGSLQGVVVDWKLDSAGIGVYFVLETGGSHEREVYRMLPLPLRTGVTYRGETGQRQRQKHVGVKEGSISWKLGEELKRRMMT